MHLLFLGSKVSSMIYRPLVSLSYCFDCMGQFQAIILHYKLILQRCSECDQKGHAQGKSEILKAILVYGSEH